MLLDLQCILMNIVFPSEIILKNVIEELASCVGNICWDIGKGGDEIGKGGDKVDSSRPWVNHRVVMIL